jgi:hypothetical protein
MSNFELFYLNENDLGIKLNIFLNVKNIFISIKKFIPLKNILFKYFLILQIFVYFD